MKKKKTNFRKIWKVIVIVLAVYLVSQIVMTKIIYDAVFPRYDKEQEELTESLMALVEQREYVTFDSGEYELQGYYYMTSDGKSNQLVVIAPGLNSGADNYLRQIEYFVSDGFDVFAFDSTGSCNSTGKSQIGFSQEVYDLDAALGYVESNYQYEDVYLFGHSRGGYSVCAMLGSEHEISAVATISGLNSAMEAVMGLSGKYVGKLAYSNYPLLWLYQVMLFDMETVNISAEEKINDSTIPVLVVQGTQDDTAPMEEFSIYSHKENLREDDVCYYICDTDGKNGHTNLMFETDGTVNIDCMQNICEFYRNSQKR